MFDRLRHRKARHSPTRNPIAINKINLLIIGTAFLTVIIIIRLFQLQIIQHDYYQEIATREQYGFVELPAARGEIIIKDYHSKEEFLLATNTRLNLLYADPALITDPSYLANQLSPLIFDLNEAKAADNERIKKLAKNLPAETTEEEKAKLLAPLTDDELQKNFQADLLAKISAKKRPQITLIEDLTPEKAAQIIALKPAGIEIKETVLYAYPPQIGNPASTAEQLAEIVEIPAKKLTTILKGENRYVILKRKLLPEISDKIEELRKNDEKDLFRGIGMKEEFFRYYPEGTLASNIIGYVDGNNMGQYGIESSFNTQLQGIAGKLQTKKDSIGRQITVGESDLKPAIDGDDVVLTIDRSIQLKVEKILEAETKKYNADSGQVIVMEPKTGKVLAMAHYPAFNPNTYGDVFKKVPVTFTPEEVKNLYPGKEEGVYYYYTNPLTLNKYLVFEQKDENGQSAYFRYENYVGPEVYHNKIVSWPYEPGSVFKTVAMTIAIDDGDLSPNSTYNDYGPVGVDFNKYSGEYDFEIKNVLGYFGLVNMTTILAKSLNTGMTYVAKTMGPALFYSYLDKFGFLDRTDIEFDTEKTGTIEYFEDWTESELATHAFGQGLTVTMVQLANAYSAIVNGGILMQPHIVEEIRHDDETITAMEPIEIRRVISEETSSKMITMLKTSAEEGEARNGQVQGHYIGGKTGTSQTYKYGQALTGNGTTIATYAGFGPINEPKFVILIKYDYPKTSIWGSSTAAFTFKEIATYLFDYYNIPPDK